MDELTQAIEEASQPGHYDQANDLMYDKIDPMIGAASNSKAAYEAAGVIGAPVARAIWATVIATVARNRGKAMTSRYDGKDAATGEMFMVGTPIYWERNLINGAVTAATVERWAIDRKLGSLEISAASNWLHRCNVTI